ncbi:MAG: UTP--glucose-1-phosphate uridylyltransferase [Verrucomicrobia bacterium]|nr:UTP--glucose-1-phosphate uridylyltransferase [Verrucomicrobiota bacterium]
MQYFRVIFFVIGIVHCFSEQNFIERGLMDNNQSSSLKEKQKQFVLHPVKEDFSSYRDWTEATLEGSTEDILCGETLLKEGKVGCLLLAGGQGSRLGEGIAKGRVNVSLVQNKSLFQIFFEKTLYAGLQCGRKLPIAIMTSFYNHEETVEYLSSHNWFGLSEDQVYFFSQENLPFCDEEGNQIFQESGAIMEGPDGNGKALHRMYESGVLDAFRQLGVEHVNMIQIDNPLADPFDKSFIGFHHRKESDISIIAVTRESEGEKAGVLASDNGFCRIVEYTEKLQGPFSLLNTGLFCFKVDFIERIGKENKQLPWHIAYKKISEDKFAWKFEYFIFDVFSYAKTISVFVEPRSGCFSPLKNAEGDKSLKTVRRDLLQKDRDRYTLLTGKDAPASDIELSFAFYYPKPEEIILWKEVKWPSMGYITPEAL